MPLKIWGRPNSNNVKKALWAAEEAKVAYESILAGLQYGIVNTPEYRALNPNGVVPTLEDGDLVVWESNAIVRYLAAEYAPALVAQTPKERAVGDKWMDWASTTFSPAFRPAFWGMVRTKPEDRNMDDIRAGVKKVNELLGYVNAELEKRPYLGGNDFSIADIPLGAFVYAWYEMDVEREDYRNVRQWYERLRERPAYQKAVMIPLT